MNTPDYIILAVLAAIIGGVVWYIVRAKKSGKKCIGCPDGGCSGSKDGCGCGCCGGEKTNND